MAKTNPPANPPSSAASAAPADPPSNSSERPRGSRAQPLKVRNKAEAAALPPPDPNSGLLTEEQAATFLNLSKFTLLRWRHDRTGPPWVQIGKRRVGYRRVTLETWLASQEVQL